MTIIGKAIKFATEAHKNQVDDSGKPFFHAHCFIVGSILTLISDDKEIIAAGYLHDTIEDTNVTYDILVKKRGYF